MTAPQSAPPGTDSPGVPRTAAGRALLDTISLTHAFRAEWHRDILAIEAEAVALGMEAADATPELRGFGYEAEAAASGRAEAGLRTALEALLLAAFKDDMFLTQNSIPMEATPGVRRAVKQARAALAAQPSVPSGADVQEGAR